MAETVTPPTPTSAMDAFRSGFSDLLKPDAPAATPPPDETGLPDNAPPSDAKPESVPAVDRGTQTPDAVKPAAVPDPEEKWPRTAAEWKKFKEARKERETALTTELESTKKQIKDFESKLANATATASNTTELDSLKKERDDLSERLRLTAVERHPEFQKHFEGKTAAQLELAKRIVGPDKAEAIIRILQMEDGQWKDQQIEELTAELSPLKQGQVAGVLNALSEISQAKANVLSNAKGHYDKLVAEQQEQSKQRQETYKKTFDQVLAKAQDPKEGMAVFQKRDGDVEWNAGVDKRIEVAKHFFSGKVDSATVVQAALDAAALPAVLGYAKGIYTENEKLKAQVAELTKAGPRIESGSQEQGGDDAPKPVPVKVGMNPMDAGREFFKVLQGDLAQR